MNRKFKISMPIIIILSMFILYGCGNSQFNDSYEAFKKTYVQANDFSESIYTENIIEFVRVIDLEEYENAYKALKLNFEVMNNIASNDAEKFRRDIAGIYLEDMEYVLYARKNIDRLTEKEERELVTKILLIDGNVEYFQNGND